MTKDSHVLRQDAVWSKACCAPNNKGEATTCVRQSAMKWMCQLESLVASNAYSKTVRKVRPLLASIPQGIACAACQCKHRLYHIEVHVNVLDAATQLYPCSLAN